MKTWTWGVVCLVMALNVHAAGVYKWVDEQGRVHYGERPPSKAPAQEVRIKESAPQDAPVVDTNRGDQQQRLLRAFDEERALKEEAGQRSQAEAAQREHNCAQARNRLARYQQSSYLYDVDAQGNRRVLDDNEHAAALREAEAAVAQWCD